MVKVKGSFITHGTGMGGPHQSTSNANVGTSHCKMFVSGIGHSAHVFLVLFSLSLLLLL